MVFRSLYPDGHLTVEHYSALWSEWRYANLLLRSSGIAAGATLIAVLIGVMHAFVLIRTRFPLKHVWRRLYLLPLCIPPHIHAIAWICLCGETGPLNKWLMGIIGADAPVLNIYTPAWAALILGLAYHPLVTLLVAGGLRSMDRRMEEAAMQYMPMHRVLHRVTLPLLMPHILSGAVFVFVFSFFNYGVASLLRVHTYPVEIFAQFSAFYNEAAATALSVPVILIALSMLVLQRYWMRGRSYVVMDTGRSQPALIDMGRLHGPMLVAMIMLGAASVVLPLAVLAVQTKAATIFSVVWQNASREIIITTTLSVVSATAIIALAYLLGGALSSSKGSANAGLDLFCFAPLALPATVLGIGMIYIWNRPATQMIYTSAAILVIVYAARFVPFSLRAVLAGMQQIGPAMRDAAALYQARWLKRLIKIELPLSMPGIVAGWCIAFILCMGELGATLLIVPAGMGTISLKIYTLMHYGANQMVAALSIILVGANLLVAAGCAWMLNRFNPGMHR
jgi:iron(III) transport system permease protein